MILDAPLYNSHIHKSIIPAGYMKINPDYLLQATEAKARAIRSAPSLHGQIAPVLIVALSSYQVQFFSRVSSRMLVAGQSPRVMNATKSSMSKIFINISMLSNLL